ncbi:MAG: TIGR02147 family protein [Bdellovibrionota bacterium]
MIFDTQNYREFLRGTLARKNGDASGGHSARSLSEKLGISTSFLSEVLNAKKNLSVDLAFKIAIKLNLTETESQYFCLLVQLEQEKDPLFREEISRRLAEMNPKRKSHDLSADLFRSISEWYHSAILELTYVAGPPVTAESAAAAIGITKYEAESAIERLLRLELLERNAEGRLQKTHAYVTSQSHVPSAALKEFHRQHLAKAGEALAEFSPKERMSATDVVAFDSRQLEQVDRLSREFSAAVMKLAEKAATKDSVYSLSVHFHPLTKREKKQ